MAKIYRLPKYSHFSCIFLPHKLYLYDLVKSYLVFVDHKFPSKIDDVIFYVMPSLQLVINCDFLGKGESTLRILCTLFGYILVYFGGSFF